MLRTDLLLDEELLDNAPVRLSQARVVDTDAKRKRVPQCLVLNVS